MTIPGFKLLYEKGPCIVVQKPGGVLTQAPRGVDSLEVRIKAFLQRRERRQGNVYLGIPHRLDRPASGAMLFAKHSRAARRLAEQFEGRLIKKTYWAFVEGQVLEDRGTWRDWLRKIPGEARAEVVSAEHEDRREAIMHFQALARLPSGTLLRVNLETGRTHQIRVQAASRGFPLLGDNLYGAQTAFGPVTTDPRKRWIALHAITLGFQHPMTREEEAVSAPLPRYWKDLDLPPV